MILEFPTIDKFAKEVAERVLDEFTYEGKTVREWVEILVKQRSCEDYISREETLKAFAEKCGGECACCKYNGSGYDSAENCKLIKSMPSVTPKGVTITDFADRCRECGKINPCEDCISREAVKEMLTEEWTKYMPMELDINLSFVLEKISELPSVTPSRPKGKWIEKAEDYYKVINEYGGGVNKDTPYFVDDIACPKCLKLFSVIDNETERFDFCPNCGARMTESEG